MTLISRLRPKVHHDDGGGAPQPFPACENYIGRRPSNRPRNRHGKLKVGRGFCPSCKRTLWLSRGRIPEHDPGPPPFTHCHCGDWLPAWYPVLRVKGRPRHEWGAYNDVDCPNCAAATEQDSIDRGDSAGWDPDDTAE